MQANTLPTLQVSSNSNKTKKNKNIFVSFNNGHGVPYKNLLSGQKRKSEENSGYPKKSENIRGYPSYPMLSADT